eukprot:1160389-Pelagomonas_calceolata.AAC.5
MGLATTTVSKVTSMPVHVCGACTCSQLLLVGQDASWLPQCWQGLQKAEALHKRVEHNRAAMQHGPLPVSASPFTKRPFLKEH